MLNKVSKDATNASVTAVIHTSFLVIAPKSGKVKKEINSFADELYNAINSLDSYTNADIALEELVDESTEIGKKLGDDLRKVSQDARTYDQKVQEVIIQDQAMLL